MIQSLQARRHYFEEQLNSLTHGLGFLLSLWAMFLVSERLPLFDIGPKSLSVWVYGMSVSFLFLASTLYHAFSHRRIKYLMQKVDHISIYLIIAGTYSPFSMVTLENDGGQILLLVVWVMAFAGSLLKAFFGLKYQYVSTVFYLVMGWLIIARIGPMIENMPPGGFAWVLAGGLSYTAGVIFYIWERLPFHHVIWHLFVMAGAFFHYWAIFFYVIPQI